MARLPIPGGDNNVWGNVLNDFLAVEHNADGTLKIRSESSTKTFKHGQTWTIGGFINVAQGDIDYLNPVFIGVGSGQTVQLVSCRYRINAGTSATVKLQRNGVDVSGFTGISVTTTAATTNPTNVTLADGDTLQLVVTAISGSPQNLSFTAFFETTV